MNVGDVANVTGLFIAAEKFVSSAEELVLLEPEEVEELRKSKTSLSEVQIAAVVLFQLHFAVKVGRIQWKYSDIETLGGTHPYLHTLAVNVVAQILFSNRLKEQISKVVDEKLLEEVVDKLVGDPTLTESP